MRNIRQNLFFAFFYNALGVPIAAGVLYPFFGLLLNPMIASCGHDVQLFLGNYECATTSAFKALIFSLKKRENCRVACSRSRPAVIWLFPYQVRPRNRASCRFEFFHRLSVVLPTVSWRKGSSPE